MIHLCKFELGLTIDVAGNMRAAEFELTYKGIDLTDHGLETVKLEDTLAELNKAGLCIHPRILAFPTGIMKTNWIPSVTEAERWEIFSPWFQAPKKGAFVSIGCFST